MKKLNYNKKKIIAVVLSLLLAFIGIKIMDKALNSKYKDSTSNYVAAVGDISPGEIITQDKLKIEGYNGTIPMKYMDDIDSIIGKKASEFIYSDEPIIQERIEDSSDESAEDVRKQYSLKLLPEDAVAGTIRSGDKVKILGTLINGTGDAKTEYVLKDENGEPLSVKVIAAYDVNGAQLSTADAPASMFVFEVTKEQAELLDNAVSVKKLKLVRDAY